MTGKNEGGWRCVKAEWKFCPIEGCPKSYGCARDKGWKLGDPSPPECTGRVASTQPKETISVR